MSGANVPPAGPRPTDPKRFQSVDMYAENTEGDIEYQRMVKDIEEMQQRQGWLTGRGAFDKADLLYLRDTAEQQRHIEMEQRDTETAAFAAARAAVDREEALESLLPLKSSGSGGLGKPPITKSTKPLVAPRVKVKSSCQRNEGNASSGSNSSQPSAKKPRVDIPPDAPAVAAGGTATAAAAAAPSGAGVGGSTAAAASPADPGSSRSSLAVAGAAAATQRGIEQEEGDDAAAGLGGLLGGYGSASESDADSDHQQQQRQQHPAVAAHPKTVQLPSAEDALAQARAWDPDAEKEPEEPRKVGFGLLGAQDDTGLLDWGDGPEEDEQRPAAAGRRQDHDRRQQWV